MNIITLRDKNYPALLRKIGKDAPEKIYYKGEWNNEILRIVWQ